MKTLMMLMTVFSLAATSAFATVVTTETARMRKLNFDKSLGVSRKAKASVSVDYVTRTITVTVKDGAKSFDVSVPVVAENTSCGSRILIARQDGRPVDGVMQELVVQDNRTRTCKDVRDGMTEVTFRSEFYNRMTGQAVERLSTLAGDELQPVIEVLSESAALEYLSGSFKGRILDAKVTLSGDQNRVKLFFVNDTCPIGARCIVGPRQYEIDLPVFSVQDDGCGSTVIRARTPELIPGGISESVTVTDNRHRMCEDYRPHATQVEYTMSQAVFPSRAQQATFGGAQLATE